MVLMVPLRENISPDVITNFEHGLRLLKNFDTL